MADWTTPKTDWEKNPKPPVAEDFNRIEGNIQHVFEQVEAKKGAIVSALNDIDMPASIEDSYSELADKIKIQKLQIHTLNMSVYVPVGSDWVYIGSVNLGTDLIKMVSIIVTSSMDEPSGLAVFDFQTGKGYSIYYGSSGAARQSQTSTSDFIFHVRYSTGAQYRAKMVYTGNVLNFYVSHTSAYNQTMTINGTLYAYR